MEHGVTGGGTSGPNSRVSANPDRTGTTIALGRSACQPAAAVAEEKKCCSSQSFGRKSDVQPSGSTIDTTASSGSSSRTPAGSTSTRSGSPVAKHRDSTRAGWPSSAGSSSVSGVHQVYSVRPPRLDPVRRRP